MAEPRIAIDILVNCQTGTNNLRRFNKELNNTVNGANKIAKTTNWLSKGLTRFIGAYFGVQTVKNIVNTYRNLDLARRSIEGLTHSTQDWEFLTKEAFRTATAIDVVAQSYKGFYAAANMSKFSKDQIQSMYGDLLTGLRGAGSTPERVKGALLAIEQMLSKGTIQAQELRLQLGNALPGAFELMASAVGVTTKELDTMMRKGLLPATKYVPLLIKEIKDYYKTGFIKNVQSLDAALINLNNAWKLFQDEIMRGQSGQGLAKELQKVTEFLRSKDALKLAEDVGKLFQLLVKCLGVIVNIGEYLLQIKPVLLVGAVILGIKGLNKELLVTIGLVARVLAPLLLAEDLILGLGQHFAGWNVKSNIGDMLDAVLGKKGEDKSNRVELFGRDTDLQGLPSAIRNNKNLMKQYRRLQRNNDWEGISKFVQTYGKGISTPNMRPTYMSTIQDRPSELSLDKSQTLSMGDVTINVNGSGNPQETAYAVKDVLISMFTGQTGVTA